MKLIGVTEQLKEVEWRRKGALLLMENMIAVRFILPAMRAPHARTIRKSGFNSLSKCSPAKPELKVECELERRNEHSRNGWNWSRIYLVVR